MSTRNISCFLGENVAGITYRMFDADGPILSAVTTGIENPQTGVYYAAGATDTGAIGVHWYCDNADIVADEIFDDVIAAIKAKTDLITTGSVTITSPVNAAGDAIALFRGDDYKNASGRAVAFTGITNCPSLTGGTVLLKIGSSISQSGTVTAADACRFDLTSAQTAALARSSEPYEVQATLSNGDVTTIVTGTATITGQI